MKWYMIYLVWFDFVQCLIILKNSYIQTAMNLDERRVVVYL